MPFHHMDSTIHVQPPWPAHIDNISYRTFPGWTAVGDGINHSQFHGLYWWPDFVWQTSKSVCRQNPLITTLGINMSSSLFDPPWPGPRRLDCSEFCRATNGDSWATRPRIPVWHATFPVVFMENEGVQGDNLSSAPISATMPTHSWHLNHRHNVTAQHWIPRCLLTRKGGLIPGETPVKA